MSNFVGISDARENLPELVDKVSENLERVTITVHGKPKAVLLSLEDLESMQETAEIIAIPGLKKDIKEGMKEAGQGKGIPLSDLK
jgi:antitoxin YefM